jgi:hypothetical protein
MTVNKTVRPPIALLLTVSLLAGDSGHLHCIAFHGAPGR